MQSCLDNVEQYFKDAHLLIENGSYGHAFAFTVLGEEELSKAYIYHECSEGFLPYHFVNKIGKGRESHKRKQAIQAVHVAIFAFVKSLQNTSLSKKEANENWDKDFERMTENIARMRHSEVEKQNGLYVDLRLDKGVIVTPDNVSKQTVEKRLAIAEEALRLTISFFMHQLTPSERETMKAKLESSGALDAMEQWF